MSTDPVATDDVEVIPVEWLAASIALQNQVLLKEKELFQYLTLVGKALNEMDIDSTERGQHSFQIL